MKVCLKRVNSMCNEYNLVICADKCIGMAIRRNLPKCICGDGIKINIIVTGCDGVLCPPALPCNNVVALSSPIRIIRRDPCKDFNNLAYKCDNFDFESEDYDFDNFTSNNNEGCNFKDSSCSNIVSSTYREQEYAIIVRSFSPALSQFLCEFPQVFLEDNDRTVRLIFIFDKNGSIFAPPPCNNGCGFGGNCGGGCGGFGGCGFGGCGCGGGFFGLAALALLFCCC